MVFSHDSIDRYYLEYDVTNIYEVFGMSLLILVNIVLLLRMLLNFRAILIWYLQNEEVDPKKLLCINATLLISVISTFLIKMFSSFDKWEL
jgi:hypothetical protein